MEGEEAVAAVAHLTMLVGSVLAFVHARYPRVPWAVALFAPAAAAFVVARFFTSDPYRLPSLQRYSEGWGAGGVAWILGCLQWRSSWRRLARRREPAPCDGLHPAPLWITSVLAVTR